MKIKVTSDRMPWCGGKARALDEIVDAPDDEAQAMIDKGLAEAIRAAKPAAKKAADGEAGLFDG